MFFGRTPVLALALAAGLATSAGAQDAECDIPEKGDIAKASFQLTQARNTPDLSRRARALKGVVKTLTEKPEKLDAAGRNYVLGQALTEWMVLKTAADSLGQTASVFKNANGYVVTRGDVGFASAADQTVDLLVAADEAFDEVERLHPSCVALIGQWRQQDPWLRLINAGVALFNEGQIDSAETVIRRSMVIADRTPYPYHLLAIIAQNRDSLTKAIELRQKAIEHAGADTNFADIRRQSQLLVGQISAQQAEAATGAEKDRLLQQARTALQTLQQEAPQSEEARQGEAVLAQLMTASGDTASVKQLYSQYLVNPTQYTDDQLMQAGVIAYRAEQFQDAQVLFQAAANKNPHRWDALYSLAATMHENEQFQPMLPVLERLVKVAPNNPDVWRLYAFAYQGVSKATKDQARRKAQIDSLLMYNERAEKLPVTVTVTEFSKGQSQATLGGTITNKSGAAKAYTLQVEFLDAAGNVVATKEVTVGPVAPEQTERFTLSAEASGVTAFRYAPLS